MKLYPLVILLAVGTAAILVACGGGGSQDTVSPTVTRQVIDVGESSPTIDFANAKTCEGGSSISEENDSARNQQVEALNFLASENGSFKSPVVKIECLELISADTTFATLHLVVRTRSNGEDVKGQEQEATINFQMDTTSGQWHTHETDLPLVPTEAQQKINDRNDQTTQELADAQATATYEEMEARRQKTAEAEPGSVSIVAIAPLEWDEDPIASQSGFPFFYSVEVTINNTSSRTVFVNLKAMIHLGDGTDKDYKDDECCWSAQNVDPGTQVIKFDMGVVVPEDYRYEENLDVVNMQGKTARIAEARLVFSEGEIEGEPFYP